jgi:2EXR family
MALGQLSAGAEESLTDPHSADASLNPGSWSPGTNVGPNSPAYDTQASEDSQEDEEAEFLQHLEQLEARRRERPKVWKPHLEKFTLFSKLPIEIRQGIWKSTLQPRVVQIYHTCERGFYSLVQIPVALRVDQDSRSAVSFLYHMSFGNILHPANIVFNFSLDTLYFDDEIWHEIPNFLVGLKDLERNQLQSIAVDRFIDDVREWDDMYYNPYINMDCLKTATASMPALREIYIVVKFDGMWCEHTFPQGNGALKLFEDIPFELHEYLLDYHLEIFDLDCDCMLKPKYDSMLKDFNVPKKGTLLGWWPVKTKD